MKSEFRRKPGFPSFMPVWNLQPKRRISPKFFGQNFDCNFMRTYMIGQLMLSRRLLLPLLMCVFAASEIASQKQSNQISDDAFRKMISDFSEPGGFFVYENF